VAVDVLVTGAGGALGSRIVKTLRANGRHVAASGRIAGADIDTVWDISQQDGPVPDCHPKAVVHAAAQTGTYQQSITGSDALFDVNVMGTLRVARWCVSLQIEHLVMVSGAIVYGEWDDSPMVEDSPASPWKAGPYAVSKMCSEQIATTVKTSGTQLSILRFSSLYGDEYKSGLVQRLLKEGIETGTIGLKPPVDDAFDLLHIKDAARTVERALDSQRSGIWNVGGGGLTKIEDLVRWCAKRTGAKVALSENGPVRPRRIINWVNDTKARTELGHTNEVPLESGIDMIFANAHAPGA